MIRRAATVASLAAAVLSPVVLWWPVWDFYSVPVAKLSPTHVQQLVKAPDDPRLAELAIMDSPYGLGYTDEQLIEIANGLLRGTFIVPNIGRTEITLPFDGQDYAALPESFHIYFAALHAPVNLLQAFELTGDEDYYALARDMLVGWAKYDRSTVVPEGLQWNDHVVAASIYVMTRFWMIYRSSADFDLQTAAVLLASVNRAAELLAKDRYYTAATNHGTMQSLALLHVALAFPGLGDSRRYRETGIARLDQQFDYLLSSEGIVLEHSAGYHEFGLKLMTDYARYRSLLGLPVPPDWLARYRKAVDFYAALYRDDKSIPRIGDTYGPAMPMRIVDFDEARVASRPNAWTPPPPQPSATVAPMSGFGVWWHAAQDEDALGASAGSQLAATWSRFPSNTHKHADDLGITLWRNGTAWITSTGYWPYWSPLRDAAVSWPASNAPHFRGEAYDSDTRSRLVGHVYTPELAHLDMARTIGGNEAFRRQVTRLPDGNFVIVDSVSGDPGLRDSDTVVVWTGAANKVFVDTDVDEQNVFGLQDSDRHLLLSISSDADLFVSRFRGEARPFRGWVSTFSKMLPAPAVEISASQPRWIVSHFRFGRGPADAVFDAPAMIEWVTADDWLLRIDNGETELRLARNGNRLAVGRDSAHSPALEAQIQPAPATTSQRQAVVDAYKAAVAQYPRYRPLLDYRYLATAALLVLFAFQELVFAGLRQLPGGYVAIGRAISAVAWAGLTTWLLAVYLV